MTTRKYNSKLKAAIKASGLLQYWVAGKAGVSQFKLSQIINGHQEASADEKRWIAKAIGHRTSNIF